MNLSSDHDGAILPEDVVFGILSWLPAIYVLRFKSICKSWYTLIQSSSFVDHHRKCVKNYNNPTFIIAGNHPHRPDLKRFQGDASRLPTLNLLTIKYQSNPAQLELDSPYLREFSNKEIDVLICNGIVCLHVSNEGEIKTHMNVSLWNPATKKLLDLLQSPFPLPTRNHSSHVTSIGFGFDAETNDYKFVRIFTSYVFPDENRVELYSLKTDSWRTVDAILSDIDYICSNPKTPYREKTYCWLGSKFVDKPNRPSYFIMTFDFTYEVFGTVSLPDVDAAAAVGSIPQMALVRENIAYVKIVDASYFDTYSERYIEVWMLYEFGVCESWTKLYKVGPFRSSRHLGKSENGNFLVFGREAELYIYNVVTGEITNYSTRDIWSSRYLLKSD